MHSSTIVASLFAALAIAAPAHQALHKKAIVWDIVTEIVTVTVTAGQTPETVHIQKTVVVAPQAAKVRTTKSKTKSKTTTTTTISSTTTTTTTTAPTTTTTTTTTTPPPPPPTTTTTTLPPPPPTSAPAPVIETPEPVVQVESVPTPAPVVVSSSSSTGDGVKDAALNAHNAYRAKHHAGPVSWDDSLASSAAQLASGCTNQHGLIVGGQNIAAKGLSGSEDSASLMSGAVDSWYNEVNQFGPYYGQPDVSDFSVLHFTQVVWKSTSRIGCAVSNCGTGSSFFPGFNAYTIVCNYQAAGNFGGEYADNVAAP